MTDEETQHRTYCRFCSAMCGVIVTTRGDAVVEVRGDANHPHSRGYTCPKGRALGAWQHHPDRLDRALVRRDGALTAVSPGAALDDLAAALASVRDESGGDAIAFYLATATAFDAAGGRIAGALQRALGSAKYTSLTIDTPSRPYVFDLVGGSAALSPALDHDETTLTILVGTNPVVSHGHSHGMPDPVRRLRALATSPKELWVIDPRRTASARLATRHVAIRPGTDWALLAHLVRELLQPGGGADVDYFMARARGIEQLAAAVEPWTREATAARCGIEADALDDLLAAIRRHRRLAVQTGTGSSMARHAVATEWLACALQIITGSYEAPGGLWFQPGFLRCFDRRTTRPSPDEGSPVRAVQSRPDLVGLFGEVPCAALADEIDAGNVRALVVVGGNPLTAFPELDRLRAAFAKLDVLCVVDVIETETSRVATHVLPAAGQLERADVPDYVDQYALEVASQYTPAIVPLFADRRPMWWWFGHLGARLGCPVLPDGLDPDDCSDDGILEAIASRARATFDDLRAADGPLIASGPVRGWVHEQVLPGGRWRIAPQPCIDALAEAAREDEPTSLTLVAGRQLATMNSQLRDVTAPGATPERAVVRLHPGDGVAAGLTDGAMVEVRSRTGRTTGVAVFDETIRRGVVHVPHGRTSPEIGALTSTRDGVDPRTGMVLQTAVPVELRALDGAIADERARTW